MPQATKFIIGLILIAAIVGGFWLVNWKTQNENLKSLQTELQTKQVELDNANRQKETLASLKEDNAKLIAQLNSVIQEQLTAESESEFVPSYIADVERLVEQQRARMGDPDFIVESLDPGTEDSNKDNAPEALAGYPTRGFQMSLTGRYATVVDFLRQLGALKLKRLVTVSRINLTLKGTPEDYSKSPVLNVTLPITVYMRKESGN